MPADAGAIAPRKADVDVQAMGAKRTGQRHDLQRLNPCLEDLGIADGARHPEARVRERPHTGKNAAGAKRVRLGDALQLRSQIGPGRQAKGVRAHSHTYGIPLTAKEARPRASPLDLTKYMR